MNYFCCNGKQQIEDTHSEKNFNRIVKVKKKQSVVSSINTSSENPYFKT